MFLARPGLRSDAVEDGGAEGETEEQFDDLNQDLEEHEQTPR